MKILESCIKRQVQILFNMTYAEFFDVNLNTLILGSILGVVAYNFKLVREHCARIVRLETKDDIFHNHNKKE
jgi:glycopeptide antibiotics resistance protein